jgi:hypothetical protein
MYLLRRENLWILRRREEGKRKTHINFKLNQYGSKKYLKKYLKNIKKITSSFSISLFPIYDYWHLINIILEKQIFPSLLSY